MKIRKHIVPAITIALLALWIPVSLDKIVNYDAFRMGILMQPLSYTVAYMAIYSLPVLEISIVVLLVMQRYRWVGFGLSSLLMAAFTLYIGLALLGVWGTVPCGCGSVISWMSWKQHLWFNLFFLAISVSGWIIQKRTRKDIGPSASTHVKPITDLSKNGFSLQKE